MIARPLRLTVLLAFALTIAAAVAVAASGSPLTDSAPPPPTCSLIWDNPRACGSGE